MDLPFSPRAAFIWDHTLQAIAWMNAAARVRFGLSPEGSPDVLPKSLIRKFSKFLEKAESGKTACLSVKLKIARHPAFDCCLDVLELAGGRRGLVVAEAGDQRNAPVRPLYLEALPKSAPGKMRTKRKPAAAVRLAQKRPEIPPPQLTPEELRSFKAIGRTVRKLCQQQRPAPALPPAAGLPSHEQKCLTRRVQTHLRLPFSAFDTVLLLNKKLDIVGSEGRPHCFGWRKPGLLGHAAGQLFPAGEQVIFYRMVKKLGSTAAQICRETIIVAHETGSGIPCHAVLGYWGQNDAHYFLALLTLKMPRRLKKLQHQQVSTAGIIQLAA